MPCNYVHKYLGYTEDKVHQECVPDLAAQKAYLGPLEVVMYFNSEIFVSENYGSETIMRQSKMIYTTINEEKPSYFSFDLQTTLLEDQTNIFQFGNGDSTYFNDPKQKQNIDFKV